MVHFAFGIHNHQPIDELDSVIEENYRQAYRPFLDVVREFEAVRLNLHISGFLLEWLQEHHPEYIEDLKPLVRSRQVEVLASGLYEPILTLLPEEDRLGQVTACLERLNRLFGAKPRGLWLTEQVWEQSLARTLAQAGIEYVVADDTHFRNVGLQEEDLFGYYVTEDQGRTLAVFPISKRLRNLVPFRDVGDTLKFLADQAQYQGPRLAVLFDDGEKFGSRPGTNERVYAGGWLRRFCTELSEAREVDFALFSDFLDENPPLGRVYLDNASYEEMGEWVLPADRLRQFEKVKERFKSNPKELSFLRSGYFRNFLVKYPEANRLHKRMVFVSNKIRQSRKRDELKDAARLELYKGQGNDAYWHGVFGGLYRPHLRHGCYRHLLRADGLLAENLGAKLVDFDGCGRKELVFDYRDVFLVIAPSLGGALMELDAKPEEINWLDTITRSPEAYHSRLKAGAPEGHGGNGATNAHEQRTTSDERYLHYDPLPRYSLLDHFYKLEATARQCYEGNAASLPVHVPEIALAPRGYELESHKVIMSLLDFLDEKPSHLYKEIAIEADRLRITYDIMANFWQPYRFAVDFNVLPLKQLVIDGREASVADVAEAKRVSEVKLVHFSDATLTVRVKTVPFTLWHYPIETVSSSEKGCERIHQGTALVLSWEQHKPAGAFEFEVVWR
jgi:alpha-amylase